MIDMGISNVYAQSTQNGMLRIWNNWAETIHRITHMMNVKYIFNSQRGSTITWNGEPVDRKTLIQNFLSMFGRRSVEK